MIDLREIPAYRSLLARGFTPEQIRDFVFAWAAAQLGMSVQDLIDQQQADMVRDEEICSAS